ncbi:ATP-binding protein [Histidinibacterium aquaticum]|uniref:histidine kinase n=1 Tax=Histidinibacterium aquaticum TaxID=2613962 RepID=A0A5J5GPU7_9RHOB|nr:ATP-binding protein [Histidinibacterium aquaticum]KAA9010359.1 GHKL domain-containing protein [Histidinibacterium aquaticum]
MWPAEKQKAVRLPGFSVDTKLFRELGELLVGRESTALIELIKNAYDADATKVAIVGEAIDDLGAGAIVVSDNGIGMSEKEFASGFLRIAGRSKTGTDRRSPWFERRYTGEKGVGRLAAHKLAHKLSVRSRRWNEEERDTLHGFPASYELAAEIDWDAIEELETIADIEESGAVKVESKKRSKESAGTQLRLAPLRRQWGERERNQFFQEVSTLTPPEILLAPLDDITATKPLLDQMSVRDELRPGGFEVNYLGDLAIPEGELPAAVAGASWVIEVDCDRQQRKLTISVSPTRRTVSEYTNAEGFVLERKLPSDSPNVGFQARILQKSNGQWPARYQGVRVYYEGFRVLPYGDAKDDWLQLDRDYRARGHNELGRLRRRSEWDLPPGSQLEGLAVQGNTAVFGAVLLTRTGASDLQMLVNREGFLPNEQFTFIEETVRLAIDLQVRVRYAATSTVKQARRATSGRQKRAAERASSGQSPSAHLLRDIHQRAQASISNARSAMTVGRFADAQAEIAKLEETLGSAVELSDEMTSEATMFRVLASIGLEHAAFVHEVRSISLVAQSVAEALDRVAAAEENIGRAKKLRAIAAESREIRERLRRNAVYLADVTGIEGRRRRSRQGVRDRLERVLAFFDASIHKKALAVRIQVDEDAVTPPIFPAELTALLSNLISNAVKFTEEGGRLHISTNEDKDSFQLKVENSGARVDIAAAEKWFEPFRSTSIDIDESLGQGMGLGLTITRSLVDEYGGRVRFVAPSEGYETAVELELPKK